MPRMPSTLFRSIALVTCALSCASSPPDTGEEVAALTVATGVDYAWSHPSPSAVRADGYTFAARYLSYDPSKNLSVGEKDALWGAGVDVIVVWEQTAAAALNGYGQGRS